MGFTFDDSDTSGTASSIAEMEDLIHSDGKNAERIFPYVGGMDINSDPTHSHHRYVIDFEDMSLDEASRWPKLLNIVMERVKPERDAMGGYSVAERRRQNWWQFGTPTPALNRAKLGKERVLVMSRHTEFVAWAFQPTNRVFADSLTVVALDRYASFAVLQSRLHEIWSRFFGSSLEDRLRYTPRDCFETFPLPPELLSDQAVEQIGHEYYEYRAGVMKQTHQGLTATYNRFHDPEEDSVEILNLRNLHDLTDRAVLNAYGWTDIKPTCQFIIEFSDGEDEDENGRFRKTKCRYRWPDETRDEVLGRLLELNRQRALEEGQSIIDIPGPMVRKSSKNKKRAVDVVMPPAPPLFATNKGDE
jgi:hypothetical protein